MSARASLLTAALSVLVAARAASVVRDHDRQQSSDHSACCKPHEVAGGVGHGAPKLALVVAAFRHCCCGGGVFDGEKVFRRKLRDGWKFDSVFLRRDSDFLTQPTLTGQRTRTHAPTTHAHRHSTLASQAADVERALTRFQKPHSLNAHFSVERSAHQHTKVRALELVERLRE